jgi:hypothetical protein
MSSRSAWALAFRGYLHRVEGAWEEASRDLAEALTVAERSGDRLILLFSHSQLADIEVRQGQPRAACRRLLPLLAHQDMQRQLLGWVVPALAWARLELREASEAAELIRQSVGYTREAGELFLLADILWLQARVATQQGRSDETARAVEEGLALTRSLPYPYMEARTLQACGLLHRHRGESPQTREKLEAALAIFRRLGARKDSECVEQALAALLAN